MARSRFLDGLQAGDSFGHLELVGLGCRVEASAALDPFLRVTRHVRDEQFALDLALTDTHHDIDDVRGQIDAGQPVEGEEPLDKAKPFRIPKRLVWEAYKRVKANRGAAGVDDQSIEGFEENLENNLYKLWNRLSSGSYFPPPVKRVEIEKRGGGRRPLGVPTVAVRSPTGWRIGPGVAVGEEVAVWCLRSCWRNSSPGTKMGSEVMWTGVSWAQIPLGARSRYIEQRDYL